MKLSIIVAISKNNCIGKENKLLWNLPRDLKHFKETTTGHTVIMGRKTFESIGKPLSNRRNIIISRDVNYKKEGFELAHSLDEALEMVKDEQEVFVIGGGELYKQALPIAHKLYITKVDKEFDGDTFFPEIDEGVWKEISREKYEADEKNSIPCAFVVYERLTI